MSDWLNMSQNMAKNYHVDVGDTEAITEAINKQKVNIHVILITKFISFISMIMNFTKSMKGGSISNIRS